MNVNVAVNKKRNLNRKLLKTINSNIKFRYCILKNKHDSN